MLPNLRCSIAPLLLALVFAPTATTSAHAQSLTLEQLLKQAEPAALAREVRLRGDAKRGALVFHTSAAGCVKCHTSGLGHSPLGPNLAELGNEATDEYIIDSLLHPSRVIRKGYETLTVLTVSGQVITGLKVEERAAELVLRDVRDLQKEVAISRADIEEVKVSKSSMMPDGLVATQRDQREFYDLARYVIEVARGGVDRAIALNPSPNEIALTDDSIDLNHAGILRRMAPREIKAGGRIFHDSCVSCHGADGDHPAHPSARAFGRDKLKFGADPYSMFLTLTRGNGLMAPVRNLSPLERYEVIAYVREQFMKGRNPDYQPEDEDYLQKLPAGTRSGEPPRVQRDYGPAIASAVDRDPKVPYRSVAGVCLSVDLGELTLCYNLHSLDQVQVWAGGLLDFNYTLYGRMGGLRLLPRPDGIVDSRFDGWQWGHDGLLDYPREGLLPRGPLPLNWLDYRGRYLHGDKTILSYRIDGRDILESPEATEGTGNGQQRPAASLRGIRHTLRIGPGKELVLAVASPSPSEVTFAQVRSITDEKNLGSEGPAANTLVMAGKMTDRQVASFVAATVTGDCDGLKWVVDSRQRLVLRIPEDSTNRKIQVTRYVGGGGAVEALGRSVRERVHSVDLHDLIHGGPRRWPQQFTTVGFTGLERGAYVLDTITPPESTPWNSWFQATAVDFLSDRRMVLATHGGEIWTVSGLDEQLLSVHWNRFASGLHEPMGLKVIDDAIYVTGKDGITRLHDLNSDGEADFYECFCPDDDVSARWHAFNFDLQRDQEGNFYYAKSGQYTDFALPGAVIRVSPDGKRRRVAATGFRTPNGMGALPDGRITISDNQGYWIPASKISLLKEDGFFGYVRTSDDGRTLEKPPPGFEQPVIWMPQELDNSSGGQLWVDDARWGPLSGRLLHTSYGQGWMYNVMLQEVNDATQAAIIRLPHEFTSGVMRAAVNPVDGQVYAVGLQGWNENGRPNLRENCIQRLRYTGRPHRMVTNCQVASDGLRINFNFPLDPAKTTDPRNWVGEQWNYQWSQKYGSLSWSPMTQQPGKDPVRIEEITLGADGQSVLLKLTDLRPVHQLHLKFDIRARDEQSFQEELYWTIHRVPKANNQSSPAIDVPVNHHTPSGKE